jgi:predicted amidohydrolase
MEVCEDGWDRSEWEAGNLLGNGDFTRQGCDGLPANWGVVTPNPALAPQFSAAEGALAARGNGRRECFGFGRHAVKLAGGRTYRLRVCLEAAGLEDLNRHLVHGVFCADPSFNDGVFSYRRAGGLVIGDARFAGPATEAAAEVRLYFRFSPDGEVAWRHVSLQESEPVPPRRVKVACMRGTGDLAHWGRVLDRAGELGADVALLPEVFNGKPVADPEPLDGPTGSFMAGKARQWGMHVSGSFYERRGDVTYNTAPLYNRDGALLGTYEKNQLFDPEEDEGATPGCGFPVFETDFGRVGIIICYDSWFPETTRLLAYKGAELVLFPNAGYFVDLMPARAADNGVWIAVSSLGNPAGVWDSAGHRAGELEPSSTVYVPTSVCDYLSEDALGLVVATVDLSVKWSPACWGGPMRSAPGGRRCRQTLMEPLEPQIAREAARWWEPPCDSCDV